MTVTSGARTTGPPRTRVEGVEKVTGTARYAYEYPQDDLVYAWVVQSPIARGRVTRVDADHVLREPDVLSVLWHDNAPRLEDAGDPAVMVLQGAEIAFHGQVVALVVAKSAEAAREAAAALPIEFEELGHDVTLTEDHPTLYAPEKVNPQFPTDTSAGEPDAAFAASAVRHDQTYRTSVTHNNPMEPHASTAMWHGDDLTVFDSNQGGHAVRTTLAALFAVPEDVVRVVSTHVGGGFGSKGSPRVNVVLAVMAARVTGRPVKLAFTRQQMFSLVGYRTPTIQRVRLGADAEGRLTSVIHEVVEQTSTFKEFAEQTAVSTRMMYAAPNRRTSHRLARLDVPTPSWMRAPGECPGFYAFESAMDELALALHLDPVELRVLNEPETDPESGAPFAARNLVACLRQGAERFGWQYGAERPARRRDGRWLVGHGVTASVYPTHASPATATAEVDPGGRYTMSINATDIGTGARTALHQLAAEALDVPAERVRIHIGDTRLPKAGIAGGSMGLRSWGWAVTKAGQQLAEQLARGGGIPPGGLSVTANTAEDIEKLDERSRHAFGAQFVEVRVDRVTGDR